MSTLNGSGYNKRKGTVERERGGNINSRIEGQDRGRFGQTMGVGEWGGEARPKRSWSKTETPSTCLQWESERPIDSASAQEIPIMLKALVSTASS